jgi:hypothetical protein
MLISLYHSIRQGNFLHLTIRCIGFNKLEARLRPPTCACGDCRESKVAPKHDFLLCYQLHFRFRFLCSDIHEINQTSNRKQKGLVSKRSAQIESVSVAIRAKYTYIAMTDIDEVLWYNHCISYVSVIAMYVYLARIATETLSVCADRFETTHFFFLLLVWLISCMSEHRKRKRKCN